jgi:hypothetical protein
MVPFLGAINGQQIVLLHYQLLTGLQDRRRGWQWVV